MAKNAVTFQRCIAIGGSAGSLEVILNLISSLPGSPNAIFIIIVHRKKDNDSILADLIATRTTLPVQEVEDKDAIVTGTIYLAPPDYHLLLERENLFSLDSSEKVHYSRPSIDITFESVAETFGTRAIGILLSGANADGAAGLAAIKKVGGYTIVQDPATADVDYMPRQAIQLTPIDRILSANQMVRFLHDLL
jgi:two-component system, chemotaxis family, protein-glutamate methylesterase/glutaminase